LFDVAVDVERWLEECKRECLEKVEELTLLWTRGSELCLATVGPLRVRSHMLEGMQIVALYLVEMVEELASLRAVISYATEFTLGCSPNKAFRLEVLDKLIAGFRK
jgi:hypothetical protein